MTMRDLSKKPGEGGSLNRRSFLKVPAAVEFFA
jgi:hypothetical protein